MAFTDITGYCLVAEARFGTNGATTGVPELAVGKSTDSQATGRVTWDINEQDGIDSGWVSFELVVNAGGGTNGVTWAAQGGAVQVAYSGAQYGIIDHLTVRAGVSGADRRMSFRNLVADFYTNNTQGTPDESVQVLQENCPVASTMGQSDPIDAEQVADIVPDGSGYGRVIVRGDLRLESTQAAGTPNPSDLFGQVYVFTSTCA